MQYLINFVKPGLYTFYRGSSDCAIETATAVIYFVFSDNWYTMSSNNANKSNWIHSGSVDQSIILVDWGKQDSSAHFNSKQSITLNSAIPKQNGRHFPDDNFKCIICDKNKQIVIAISLKFVPKGPINDIPALVQIMAWHRLGTSHY